MAEKKQSKKVEIILNTYKIFISFPQFLSNQTDYTLELQGRILRSLSRWELILSRLRFSASLWFMEAVRARDCETSAIPDTSEGKNEELQKLGIAGKSQFDGKPYHPTSLKRLPAKNRQSSEPSGVFSGCMLCFQDFSERIEGSLGCRFRVSADARSFGSFPLLHGVVLEETH